MPLSILRATLADVDPLTSPDARDMQNDEIGGPKPFDESWVRRSCQLLPSLAMARHTHAHAHTHTHPVRDSNDTPVAYLVICFDFSLEYRRQGRLDR